MNYSVNIIREIWNDDTGTKIVIGPDRDGLDLIEICQYSEDGKLEQNIVATLEETQLIIKALVACSKELSKEAD